MYQRNGRKCEGEVPPACAVRFVGRVAICRDFRNMPLHPLSLTSRSELRHAAGAGERIFHAAKRQAAARHVR